MIKNAFRRAWAWVYGRVGPRGLWIAFTALLALGALSAGMAWGTWTRICDQCPSIAQIYAFEPKEATRVYAADGGLLDVLAVERRTAIPYTALPRHVIDAFISVEDRRFWKHHGVDVRRSARAAAEFAFAGYNVAGGSTITQQLAGNMFTDVVNRQDISIRRKLREMRVAKALEDAYSKTEILEAYLNQINFDGVYGIQNAAQRYFGKDARNLNLPEAALLAGMPRAPARYSPIRHPERAVPRRNLVISLMEGQGRITEEEAASAKAYPLVLRDGTGDVAPAAFFVEWVRRILYDRYGAQIYEAGFKVYTTLDPGMQNVADSAYRAQLKWIENQPDFTQPTYRETREWSEEDLAGPDMPYVQGMFIAIDPRNGDVLAMIGGRDFLDSEFNRATQARRQPGSAFKPFTYTAAVAAGIPASEIFLDTPTEYPQPDGSVWSPRNFTGRFLGPISMREALTRSINVVAVKIGARIGVGSIAQFAHRMGIRTDVPVVPSTPIGAPSVRPIELAEAYTTFANLGVRTTPQPIQRIEGADGRLIWEATIQREEVLDERVAWIMLSMLRDVVDRGTGRRVRTLGVPASVPVAGKTGTTNEATNAWFVGFTPDVVTATWIGFDLPRPIRKNAQGGVDAAPINAEVLRWYYERNPHPPAWPRPAGITTRQVDRTTGLLPTQWCPADVTVTEVYIEGTEPTGYCDAHGPFSRGVVTDSLAADSTEAPVSDDFDF